MLINRRTLAFAAAAAGAALASHMIVNSYRFRVERVQAHAPDLRDPVRVAFLADLHFGPFMRIGSVAAWVDAVGAAEPDLVLLGGDLVEGTSGVDTGPLLRELTRLRAPYGAFVIWGNHDHTRFPDLATFAGALERAGITVLRNRGVAVRDDLYVAGIDDYDVGEPDVEAALRARPQNSACLLVSHNPDALFMVPEDVDLTLCGHTHGGQVLIPGVGALVKSRGYGQLFARGWTRAPGLAYVSRGLGVGLVPMRLNCPPELTIVELLPVGATAAAPGPPPPEPPLG
jgi:uncharacterized protein